MKVIFVYPTYENLGIEYLSAVLKKAGHQTQLAFDPCLFNDDTRDDKYLKNIFNFKRYPINRVTEYKPDLVCFSCVSDRYRWACELAREIKNRIKVPIVFGGIHPTSAPEECINNDFVDFVVLGEGEGALVDLAKRLEDKSNDFRIDNVWFKKDGRIIKSEPRELVEDLDSLPFPDKDLYCGELTDFYKQYSIITSRGCPFSCTYCCNNYLKKFYSGKGRYVRYRSPQNVITELKSAKEKYKMESVLFFDEELFSDAARAKELFSLYKKEINLPFWCYINPQLMDEERIAVLSDSGCGKVEMGVQDLDVSLNKNILRRHMDLEHLKNVIKGLHKAKISILFDIIVSLPTQKEKNLLDMADFLNENRVDLPMIFWMRYYPQTEIINIALKEGILSQDDCRSLTNCSRSFYTYGSTYNPQIAKLVKLLYLCCLLPPSIIRFIIKHKLYRYFPPILARYFLLNALFIKMRLLSSLKIKKETRFFSNRTLFYLHYLFRWATTR